ncbi:MAG: hypothetical protein ACYTDY_09510 [Planctomycetota bacterium]|jgi:hypothetical protein
MRCRIAVSAVLVTLLVGLDLSASLPLEEDERLDPSQPLAYAQFGFSCDIDGDTLVVGARAEGASDEGAVYVFERGAGGWEEVDRLTDEDGGGGYFGESVAVDGDTLVVGCPGYGGAGSVFVYERVEGIWGLVDRYFSATTGPGNQFGNSVAIDGDTFVVGSPHHKNPLEDGGAAYVFVRSGEGWIEQTRLLPDDKFTEDLFGWSVDISGDRVVAGAPYKKVGESRFGAAYVFSREGETWSQQQKLTHPSQSVQGDFGYSIAIDRRTAVVGAPGQVVFSESRAGSAFTFIWDVKEELWLPQQQLTSGGRNAGEQFGFSVDIDGSALVAGANDDYREHPGAGFLFTLESGVWSQPSLLLASDGEDLDRLGMSAAIDGDTVVLGADGVTPGTGFPEYYGAAYVYEDLAIPPPPAPPPPPPERAFLLPKKVAVGAPGAGKAPAPGALVATGTADLGPKPLDLEAGGVLTIGTRLFIVPGLEPDRKGKVFTYSGGDVSIAVRRTGPGGSRAKFKFSVGGLLPGEVPSDGEAFLAYSVAGEDMDCRVRLVDGSFRLGRTPNGLLAPGISPVKLRGRVKGEGRDALKVLAGLATDGTVPEPAPPVTVRAAGVFETVIPGDSFKRKGDRLLFRGDADGVRKVVIDFAKARILLVLRSVDLGPISDGPVTLRVGVALGEDARAVEVQAVRKGNSLRY